VKINIDTGLKVTYYKDNDSGHKVLSGEVVINMNKKLVEIRMKKGLSINDLAHKLKISESMVRKVETGLRRPSALLAKRWADELKISDNNIFKYFFNIKADNMCKINKTTA
jgi:ribosome-binding protein aMBF1 (putative translation factor)